MPWIWKAAGTSSPMKGATARYCISGGMPFVIGMIPAWNRRA